MDLEKILQHSVVIDFSNEKVNNETLSKRREIYVKKTMTEFLRASKSAGYIIWVLDGKLYSQRTDYAPSFERLFKSSFKEVLMIYALFIGVPVKDTNESSFRNQLFEELKQLVAVDNPSFIFPRKIFEFIQNTKPEQKIFLLDCIFGYMFDKTTPKSFRDSDCEKLWSSIAKELRNCNK